MNADPATPTEGLRMTQGQGSTPIHHGRMIYAGDTFGRLVMLEDRARGMTKIRARCECGTERPVQISGLVAGTTRSCGCERRRHNLATTPTYSSWGAMVRRCTNPDAHNYAHYGGRGITVCTRWLESDGQGVRNFFADMGPRPDGTTLDRIDVDGNYEPANCRWATKEQQAANKRKPPRDDAFGKVRLLRVMTEAPRAFWRFDVDADLGAAVRMARFAEMAGIRATFFLMTASEFYNVFSRDGADAVSAILATGHKVGLHCNYRAGEPVEAVRRERALVDTAYPDTFCDVVSFHMPPACVLWRSFGSEFTNAYAPEWEGRYISDSRREFDAEKEALVSNDMQIALHPVHWRL